ncbi:hypothetical protein AEAC466_11135 [Asticcacaulis sp. AC466]|uniref:beta-galactosidase GalA n=1 Tax=Asticcacaulis sp. AC466 TaxID=1282362 RepID=UPI0003C3D714|nr:beta-galactosidase GalA [Asticcacaulis sp. AC466]ESQ83874.1 hypothetical protein AEAC466_11135 [Asticcacaulis sp. AC466]
MNRRELFKTISAAAFVAGVSGPVSSQAFAQPVSPVPDTHATTANPREVLSLNTGWRFHMGDIAMPLLVTHEDTYNSAKAGRARGAASPTYDDAGWDRITLPHDFASFQPIVADANVDQGYRKRGIAWYRNHLKFTPADKGRHIELQLDGIATFATVWFNGTLVARNWSGYNSTYIDLTPYATYGDAWNVLVVRVDAEAMEGWWYEGAGIYRDAWIVKRDALHIATDGAFAHPVPSPDGPADWKIPVEVTLNNAGQATGQVTVVSELWDDTVGLLVQDKVTATVSPLGQALAHLTLHHNRPRLWSPADPQLYRVETYILDGDKTLDKVTTTCGFRTERFDAQKGFFLNDTHMKLKGVCLHQDHAGVGTAVPDGVIDFRLRKLKALGCNAIRFSHNAQNKALMDACDRHGFLVMAENRNFNASPDYLAQLEWLVRRDRNHPSIILWSVFNEEPMQATEQGYEMVRRMSAVVKALDTTRPVTAAMNGGLDAPLSVAHAVDVVGINYQQDKYDLFHTAHPNIPVSSSEDTSAFMTRGEYISNKDKHIMASYDDEAAPWGETHRAAWKAVAERDYIAGQFVWTGFDYHGEPTPFTFPSNSSYFGIMDLCGFEKAAFYIHQAQWINDTPVLALVPHWNWKSGDKVRVMACTNLDEVELLVNGKLAGRQAGNRFEMNYWTVPYAPGHIEARGYRKGKLVKAVRVETTGPAIALRLIADRKSLSATGLDAQPVRVEAVDAKGRSVPLAQDRVTFEIDDGAIIGLGNGDPTSLEPEKGNVRSLFNGLAQVIVQAGGKAGTLRLRATAPGLKAADLIIPVTAARPLASQATKA